MTEKNRYIEVAIPAPVFSTFTYRVCEGMEKDVAPGRRAVVPFGNRKTTGYILGPDTRKPDVRILDIIEIKDPLPLFPESMIPFFRWMSSYYIYPLGRVIAEALPSGINPQETRLYSPGPEAGKAQKNPQTRSSIAPLILDAVSKKPMTAKELEKALGKKVSAAVLSRMSASGLLVCDKRITRSRVGTKKERFVSINKGHRIEGKLSRTKAKLIDILMESGEMAVSELKKLIPTAANHVRDLGRMGIVRITEKPVFRDPFGDTIEPDTPPELTSHQRRIVRSVLSSLKDGFRPYLLAGVTGSGKTEIYMQLAAKVIDRGKTVLVLVPEIALITEMTRRFRARFGERVAVLHSGLSAGERFDQWMRIAAKEAPIAIGARSAIFAPLDDIGLIVVDEEHDSSYKQDNRFPYNARDMAVVRGKMAGAAVILGSATPSIQTMANARDNRFQVLRLDQRVSGQSLPEVEIVDLKRYADFRGTRRIISDELRQATHEALLRGEQVLYFLNRRGYAGFPVCALCGKPQRCKHCDVTLTYHKSQGSYRCHLCGYIKSAAAPCTECGSSAIKQLGAGTERIEQMVRSIFPGYTIARMDKDTVRDKKELVRILKALKEKDVDILIGTQMVAKGHDYPNITLVGILCADLSLAFPDFRAAEQTFQILAQVAGRAGRGDRPGRVILQTFNPEHFAIQAAKAQDYEMFYSQETAFRKTFKYPPFCRMAQIRISSKDYKSAKRSAEAAGRCCFQAMAARGANYGKLEIMGPVESPISMIAGRHRFQILIKAENANKLNRFLWAFAARAESIPNRQRVSIIIDVDPYALM